MGSATRSLSKDGYDKGSCNPVMQGLSDTAKRFYPDGQQDALVKINWIEEVYAPYWATPTQAAWRYPLRDPGGRVGGMR